MTRIFQIIAAGVMLVAAPAAPERHDPRPVEHRRPPSHGEVPGIVLVIMGAAGLVIVGASARRRQPGRSVTN